MSRPAATVRRRTSLVRPHLDDVANVPLPEGVEIRPVEDDQLQAIFESHHEAFRGSWGFHEAYNEELRGSSTTRNAKLRGFLDDPQRDTTLWKVAWAGDTIVGQVNSYIDESENVQFGYRRG